MHGGTINSFESWAGPTADIQLADENYAIVKPDSKSDVLTDSVDISFKSGIIRIYSDRIWKIHTMTRGSLSTTHIDLTKS